MSHKCTEERFLKDVARHEMTIIRDDGVNRHVRFKEPGTSNMMFDLITWPGHLCYTGDMGTYVFQRLEDMFQFFRTDRHHNKKEGQELFINTGYWAEKCCSVDRHSGISEYSAEKAKERIAELLNDHEASAEIKDAVEEDIFSCLETEESLRRAVDDFPDNNDGYEFADFWEENLHVRPFRYVWCCYALAWGIATYDKAKGVA